VGLCSFIFADFNEATTMSPISVPDSLINLLYFFNVITLAAVIYTVRHHRVVNVSFVIGRGLERLGLWALVTALGALLIHRIDEGLGRELHLDNVAISLALIGVTLAWERIQEFAIELLDFVFFPHFRRRLAEVRNLAGRLWQATSIVHLERSLTERTTHELRISSAAVFRYHRSGRFRRHAAIGSQAVSGLVPMRSWQNGQSCGGRQLPAALPDEHRQRTVTRQREQGRSTSR